MSALCRVLALVLVLVGLWYIGGAIGWNMREDERFESEMESEGWSQAVDPLPLWPGVLALAAAAISAWAGGGFL